MVLCYIDKCNAEAYLKLMMYYFAGKYSKKTYCKAIIRACENDTRRLADKNTIVRIQVLA